MKKLVLVVGLATVGCGKSPEKQAIADNATILQHALEAEADNMEALADNATEPAVEQAYQNVADNLQAAKSEVRKDANHAKRDLKR